MDSSFKTKILKIIDELVVIADNQVTAIDKQSANNEKRTG